MRALIVFAFACSLAAPAAAQCVDVTDAHAQGTFTGMLEKHVYPGPPNWEDIKKGDRADITFILRLPKKICAEDGNQFADPKRMFDDIHLSSYDDHPPWDWFDAHVGQQVTLSGNIFAAERANHRAPLVMMLPQGWKPPQ